MVRPNRENFQKFLPKVPSPSSRFQSVPNGGAFTPPIGNLENRIPDAAGKVKSAPRDEGPRAVSGVVPWDGDGAARTSIARWFRAIALPLLHRLLATF